MGRPRAWPERRSETPMTLTLRQAAEKCGKSRSTIHRALQSGKISGHREDDGAWSIDPSELARVFPWDEPAHGQRDAAGHERDSGGDAAILAVRVEMLTEQLERERDTVEDLRRRLDKAEERAFALAAPSPRQGAEDGASQGLWGRLRGALGRG